MVVVSGNVTKRVEGQHSYGMVRFEAKAANGSQYFGCCLEACWGGCNLVDSASSHTLVSKIKPCMSKYKCITVKLRMAHYISYRLFDSPLLLG